MEIMADDEEKREAAQVFLVKTYTVEPRLHNNAFKGAPPLKGRILKSQNYSGFCNVKIPLLNSPCFNSDSPF